MTDLSLYLHLPFCRRRCRYCSFVSSAGREAEIPAYVRALKNEIRLSRRTNAAVRTIYFGGGTPSLFEPSRIAEIIGTIRNHYEVVEDAEVTLEANPCTVDGGYFQKLRLAGVNRVSLGVQSLDDGELKFLGRLHSAAEALNAVRLVKKAGFDNVSLDFIYGIPGRLIDTWREMLKQITGLNVRHLSLYALTLEEDTPLGKAVKDGEIPAPDHDAAAQEYEIACDELTKSDYEQYEISNWAQPGFESRHNLVYWTGGDYLGLGCAAHSYLDGVRRANHSDIDEYLAALNSNLLPNQAREEIGPATALAEAIFLGLRMNAGISADDIIKRFKIDLKQLYSTEIAELTELGLVELNGAVLKLTPRGRLLGNEVFLKFLP
jgi:oxygen-independent coproporphyrinogen-3 oxidase